MLILDTPRSMHAWSRARHAEGGVITCVPTMGALHAGHLALIDHARSLGGLVVVSIFVNPLQFNRRDDFERYPRPIDTDLDACRRAGVDAVYAPTAASMYPEEFQTHVEPGRLAERFEGEGRPGHFRGVVTVVTKLFGAMQPDRAVFGQKDYQQLAIIRRMVADLDLGIEIIGRPTVRESDGLAISSRNVRLAADQRAAAVCVSEGLNLAAAALSAGEHDVAALEDLAAQHIAAEPLARLEYVHIVDPDTLAPVLTVDAPAVILAAVWFGDVRLIDNVLLAP
jgi:pantoate--beta-alanine ligase